MKRAVKKHNTGEASDRIDDMSAPFRSYALERSGEPRFHVRLVEKTQRLYPAHKHDYFQIIYFMTEAPTARIGLTSCKPRAGSIYFIAPMVPHQIRFDLMTRCIVLYFDLDFLRPAITRTYPTAELVRLAPELTPFVWQGHIDFNLDSTQMARVEQACRSMIDQYGGERLCATEMIRGELALMLASICQSYETSFNELSPLLPAIGRDSGNMRRIADFISDNYLKGPTLEEAAKAVRLSRSRLCSLLRQYSGTSFNALIRQMRIEDARERLVLTDETISQIAYAVGYNDEKYFLRAFRKSVGMTPTAYRLKQAKANVRATAATFAFPQAGASQRAAAKAGKVGGQQ
ncbi:MULTISPECIES: helix-turn-helix domain-containing protein [unclassified Ensifer]|uniref:AraC family transcriptional regulator n=1 Tax=unclassified Ensifer TaxID=2633371 RepID=UPI00081348F5|nr:MULTISPECIES: helix-turn-helix domain-containing protein [unclassified Ensifer]OCP20918.1 hypothetical protein BC361_28025 [Ensifer sp. LC54]OCP25473.1 hypothetical protein BC363_19880 [Ensifer sp. LC384]